MRENKRIFSLNQVSFLKSKGITEYQLGYDHDKETVYFVFPETREVGKAIREYHQNKELQKYIGLFKETRDEVHSYMKSVI